MRLAVGWDLLALRKPVRVALRQRADGHAPSRATPSRRNYRSPRRATALVLQVPVEARVESAFGDELLVVTVFGDTAAIENEYAISLFHRR